MMCAMITYQRRLVTIGNPDGDSGESHSDRVNLSLGHEADAFVLYATLIDNSIDPRRLRLTTAPDTQLVGVLAVL